MVERRGRIFWECGPPYPQKLYFVWLPLDTFPSWPPGDWPWTFMKNTLNSIRPGNTQMLQKWFQSRATLTPTTPKHDARISKWDLWKYVFTIIKPSFCKFQGIPNLPRNRSSVLLTILLPKIDRICEHVSDIGVTGDSNNSSKNIKKKKGYLRPKVTSWPPLGRRCQNDPQKWRKWCPQPIFGHQNFSANQNGGQPWTCKKYKQLSTVWPISPHNVWQAPSGLLLMVQHYLFRRQKHYWQSDIILSSARDP